MTRAILVVAVTTGLAIPGLVAAQPLGTFRWQLQPYCNVITVTVVQEGGQYHINGTDDQCGATRRASVVGLAFPNPDGSIGFGLTTVTTPGGAPVHIDARITLATLGGNWSDSGGNGGAFTFTPGSATAGSPRPAPTAAVPPAISLRADGGIVARHLGGNSTVVPASGPGTRLMRYPGKAAFRAGSVTGTQWDDATVGAMSVALGEDSQASGPASTAMGQDTTASGDSSTAMGAATTASNYASTAMGFATIASGDSSTAMGRETMAGGDHSLAAGFQSQANGHDSAAIGVGAIANGDFSIALGRAFTTVGAAGSFVFGDFSNSTQQVAFAPNTFVVRAAGGARFFSHATDDIGPVLLAGGTDWLAVSDVNRKHQFRELDGEDVLGRIARMPVTEWSYKAQDPAIRHIGPTAQDFHAAFGLGQDPLRISPLDSVGVALAGVGALEARTRALQAEVEILRQRLDALIGTSPPPWEH